MDGAFSVASFSLFCSVPVFAAQAKQSEQAEQDSSNDHLYIIMSVCRF